MVIFNAFEAVSESANLLSIRMSKMPKVDQFCVDTEHRNGTVKDLFIWA